MREMRDSMKALYGKIMLAAAPMFSKLTENEQVELIQYIGNKLMLRAQGKQMCAADAHITDVDNPQPYHPHDQSQQKDSWSGPINIDDSDDE